MPLTDAQLADILQQQNYLSTEDVDRARQQAKQHGSTLKSVLTEQGLLTQDLYESAIAEYYHLPYLDIRKVQVDPNIIVQLPEQVARQCGTVLLALTPEAATFATADPLFPNLEQILRLNAGQSAALFPEGTGPIQTAKKQPKKSGLSLGISLTHGKKSETRTPYGGALQFYYTAQSTIDALLAHYRKPLATRFQSLIEQRRTVAPEILEEIINDAIQLRASDIHFEPQEAVVLVRFRVDGVMHEAGRIPREFYEGVVNRIKIEGNMRTDEHFAAQDGAIRFIAGRTEAMDIRVSIVPLVDGEKIVMRLLSAYVRSITLGDLGFSERNQKILEQAAHKPFGMILTSGPTGSGKSTTLYALLKIRNSPDVNISTIEDPVEYKLQGINHIQVNPKTNLTFASGLRALVRQDPDIILVGEIRDGETADIAVNAALTGHLLFSTVHANDAATAVPRLLDMGVEPFLLASTLEVIIAQRLVRRLCPYCRYSESVSRADIEKTFPVAASVFPEKGSLLLYKGKGCDACGGTGYRGRIGIHELLPVTPEVEELIIRRASSTEINNLAEERGMLHLFDDGFEKVQKGVTSLEELLRVAAPPERLFHPKTRGTQKR
ncbi:MAG: type IV pilus assembly protein PilB [Candidatus Peregrinibacteria bacterium Gr01-1014_25]|nr:MAG: type IV pilus assembly protein PilB [Candidatus Peregrinibacteria bacterium Gr01-1014_25]